MPREKLVYPVSDATKQAIVDASVQVIPARPVMSAAALQKLFVTPVVNAEGKACAIAEIGKDGKDGLGVYGFDIVNGDLIQMSEVESNTAAYGIDPVTGQLQVTITY